MAAALKAAGARDVTIQPITDRNHMSIWQKVQDGDPLTKAILAFVLKHE
jgi:hypothetical protein